MKLKLITQGQFWNPRWFQCNPPWKVVIHGSYITIAMNWLIFMMVIHINRHEIQWIHGEAPTAMWMAGNLNIHGGLRLTAVKWVLDLITEESYHKMIASCYTFIHIGLIILGVIGLHRKGQCKSPYIPLYQHCSVL